MEVAAIVPAAGQGRRFKARSSKVFFPIMGKPLLVHTLNSLRRSRVFKEMVVLVQKRDVKRTRSLLDRYALRGVRVEAGGATRADSVKRGLASLKSGAVWVLVHDGARPLISREVVKKTFAAAKTSGAALCALPATATVKRAFGARPSVLRTEDRRTLWLAQTPQIFRKDLLVGRYRRLGARALQATDEAALFDGSRIHVRIVEGDVKNIKVTTKEDLRLVEFYLRRFSCG